MCHSQAVSPALTMGTVCFRLKPHPLEELLLLLLYGSPKGLLGVPFFIFFSGILPSLFTLTLSLVLFKGWRSLIVYLIVWLFIWPLDYLVIWLFIWLYTLPHICKRTNYQIRK